MSKYVANPVEVDAGKITEVGEPDAVNGGRWLTVDMDEWKNGFFADVAMLARYTPVVGDYLVRQADGYFYINPKDVFERKYRAKP